MPIKSLAEFNKLAALKNKEKVLNAAPDLDVLLASIQAGTSPMPKIADQEKTARYILSTIWPRGQGLRMMASGGIGGAFGAAMAGMANAAKTQRTNRIAILVGFGARISGSQLAMACIRSGCVDPAGTAVATGLLDPSEAKPFSSDLCKLAHSTHDLLQCDEAGSKDVWGSIDGKPMSSPQTRWAAESEKAKGLIKAGVSVDIDDAVDSGSLLLLAMALASGKAVPPKALSRWMRSSLTSKGFASVDLSSSDPWSSKNGAIWTHCSIGIEALIDAGATVSASDKVEMESVLPELAHEAEVAARVAKSPVVDYPASRAELVVWSSSHLSMQATPAVKPKKTMV